MEMLANLNPQHQERVATGIEAPNPASAKRGALATTSHLGSETPMALSNIGEQFDNLYDNEICSDVDNSELHYTYQRTALSGLGTGSPEYPASVSSSCSEDLTTKAVQCDQCTTLFRSPSALKLHQRYHNSKEQFLFASNPRDERFPWPKGSQKHEHPGKHGEKVNLVPLFPYVCTELSCGEVFSREDHRNRHVLRVHKGRPSRRIRPSHSAVDEGNVPAKLNSLIVESISPPWNHLYQKRQIQSDHRFGSPASSGLGNKVDDKEESHSKIPVLLSFEKRTSTASICVRSEPAMGSRRVQWNQCTLSRSVNGNFRECPAGSNNNGRGRSNASNQMTSPGVSSFDYGSNFPNRPDSGGNGKAPAGGAGSAQSPTESSGSCKERYQCVCVTGHLEGNPQCTGNFPNLNELQRHHEGQQHGWNICHKCFAEFPTKEGRKNHPCQSLCLSANCPSQGGTYNCKHPRGKSSQVYERLKQKYRERLASGWNNNINMLPSERSHAEMQQVVIDHLGPWMRYELQQMQQSMMESMRQSMSFQLQQMQQIISASQQQHSERQIATDQRISRLEATVAALEEQTQKQSGTISRLKDQLTGIGALSMDVGLTR